MDISTMTERSAEAARKIDRAKRKTSEHKNDKSKIVEILSELRVEKADCVDYAQQLIGLGRQNLRERGDLRYSANITESPLIRVGTKGRGKHYFVSVEEVHVPESYNGDGDPVGSKFIGWQFNGSVGSKMTEEAYRSLSAEDSEGIRLLGTTLSGETIYGSVISEERIGSSRSERDIKTVERAEGYAASEREEIENITETIALLRQNIGDKKLNPIRGGLEIPTALM